MRREREDVRRASAERNKTLRINALDKALFLIAQKIIPQKIETHTSPHTRTGELVVRRTFWFDYDAAEPYASLWQQLKDAVVDDRDGNMEASDYLKLHNSVWDELEARFERVAQ